MDKLSKDEIALRKAKKYIDTLPDYARRFFNKTKLKPSSIHVYSIEIAAFFDYLGTTSIKLNKISDLEKITPEVLEDYVEYLKSATKNGKKRNSSDRTIHRIICIHREITHRSGITDYFGFLCFSCYQLVDV